MLSSRKHPSTSKFLTRLLHLSIQAFERSITPDRFDTHLLSPTELAICLGVSMLMFVWIEFEKLFQRWFLARRS